MSTMDLSFLTERLQDRVAQISDPDATPLYGTWMRIIDDDNRNGVLAGKDKNGNAMAPVTYRPKLKPAQKPVKLTIEQRLGQNANVKRGRFAAFGSTANAANNNLTSAEYRLLSGPPLAPAGRSAE